MTVMTDKRDAVHTAAAPAPAPTRAAGGPTPD